MDGEHNQKRRSRGRWTALAGIGLVLGLLLTDAIKPLHIDDPFILRVAERIAEHPLDPYGFDILWYQWPQPVHEELTPPVLPYWWALGLRVVGDHPFLWKLWMAPFAALFVFALLGLLRRVARGVELPLTAMTVLSPAFLPSLNLMQDVPAQSLGLSSMLLYLRSSERDSLGGALAAGLLAGLATQTKYTTITVLGAMLVHGVLMRRMQAAVASVAVALLVFFGWEWAMTLRYGKGMFLGQVGFDFFWESRGSMLISLVRVTGATVPWLGLLGLAAAGLRTRWIALAGAAVGAGYLALPFWPVDRWLYYVLGAVFVAGVAAATARLTVRAQPAGWWRGRLRHRTDWFLAIWFAGEIAGYLITAPFPAVRRVMGPVVVATLIVGRLVALRGRVPGTPRVPLRSLAAASAVCGVLFAAVDLREARAQQRAPAEALEAIREIDPAPRVWFLGHWGFKYYAEELGMQPVIPDHSRLRAGDWLLVPDRVDRQKIRLSTQDAEPYRLQTIRDGVALATSYGFYGGNTPLQHHRGPRLSTQILRIRRDIVPPTGWPLDRVLQWAVTAGGEQAAWAVPALVREFSAAGTGGRVAILRALAHLGPRAAGGASLLVEALADVEPQVRLGAAAALERLGDSGPRILDALRGAREDPDPAVREAAARALERLERSGQAAG